jgi:hypothetical protein
MENITTTIVNYADIEPKINLNENKFKIFKIYKKTQNNQIKKNFTRENESIQQNENENESIQQNENENELIQQNENETKNNLNVELMFKKILEITTDLSNKINILDKKFDDKMNTFEKRMTDMENGMIASKLMKKNDEQYECENLKELIYQDLDLDIDKKDVMKAMSYRDYRSMLYIFKLYYKNEYNGKNIYPIRVSSTLKFEYYYNKKWNPDLYGEHSRNVLCKNIQNLFIKYNELESGDITMEDFMLNQDFICKLMDEKKKKELFKSVAEEIKINC